MKQALIEEQGVSWREHRSRNRAVSNTLGRRRTHRPIEYRAIPRRLFYEVEASRDELEASRVSIPTAMRQR